MDNDARTPGKKDKPKATWTRDDETTLVRTLRKAMKEGKWGDNNPNGVAWTLCVGALSGSERVSGGVAKNARVIKRRWQRVRVHHISWIVCVLTMVSSAETRI
jgi:hypothetical protein